MRQSSAENHSHINIVKDTLKQINKKHTTVIEIQFILKVMKIRRYQRVEKLVHD